MKSYNKFAVIGVGRYGQTIAKRLAEKGAQVFAFDPDEDKIEGIKDCLLYTSPSPRDKRQSRMPSSA